MHAGGNVLRQRRCCRRHLIIIYMIITGTSFLYLYNNTTIDASMSQSSFVLASTKYGSDNYSNQTEDNYKTTNTTTTATITTTSTTTTAIISLNEVKIKGYLIETPGCQIPDLPPEQNSTKQFFKKQENDPKCETREWPLNVNSKKPQLVRGPPLVKSNLTTLWLHHPAFMDYNLSSSKDLSCCYRPFWRVQEDPKNYTKNADNRSKFSTVCIKFNDDSVTVNSSVEFVRVECSSVKNITNKTNEIYRDFHVFMPRKPKVEERCEKFPATDDKVSVLAIGMDSVSRLNMIRQLPKTYKLLSSPPFSAISLLGYNKVGDNTFPNLVPVLMGLSPKEINNTCFHNQKEKIDSCPFIWKNYASKGYKTAYGEDTTPLSTFNYLKTGFVEQPVDYYARPYLMESYNQQGCFKKMNVKLCTGPRQTFEYAIDYIKKFSLQFAKERYFGFFWSSATSHDKINMPHVGDSILHNFLLDLQNCGALERTVLLLMSDHGMRFGSFRETFQNLRTSWHRPPLVHLPGKHSYFYKTTRS